ncbi:MAG: hypothetical protein M5U28_34225 [Sandaracinaceae bacterium]|nr:hypothetical protein [Sandaracinaceae bacterium]
MTIRERASALLARIRAGEGAEIVADLGERIEAWLISGRVPLPAALRTPVEQLGELVGDLARAYRPERPEPPPSAERPAAQRAAAGQAVAPEPARAVAAPDRARAEAPRRDGGRAQPRSKASSAPARPKSGAASSKPSSKARVSARRPAPDKRGRPGVQVAEIASEPARKKTSNGKGRPRRPAARRKRDDETGRAYLTRRASRRAKRSLAGL